MDDKHREQARAHARFTRQRKQELIDKLQSQYDELIRQRVQSEAKAQRDLSRTRLLKQKVLQLLGMWSDAPEEVTVSETAPAATERRALIDPEVRALLPLCCGGGDDATNAELFEEDRGDDFSLLKVFGDRSSEGSVVGVEALLSSLSSQHERLGLDRCGVRVRLRFAVEVAVEAIFIGQRAAMCPFWYRSFNAEHCGASRDVELRGMLYCEFSSQTQPTAAEAAPQQRREATDETSDEQATVVSGVEETEKKVQEAEDPTISGVRLVYDCQAWNREIASAFTWELPTLKRTMLVPTNLNQALSAIAQGDKAMLLTTLAHPRKIVRVTERYCKITGYHPRELLGNALMWLDPPDVDQRSRLLDLVDDLKAGHPLMAIMQHPTNLPSTKTGDTIFDQNGIFTLTQAYPLVDLSSRLGDPDDAAASQNNNDDAAAEMSGQVKATHVLWVLREPPEPKVSPCVSALLELAVRVARALHVELANEDTASCAEMFAMLDAILVQDTPLEEQPTSPTPPSTTTPVETSDAHMTAESDWGPTAADDFGQFPSASSNNHGGSHATTTRKPPLSYEERVAEARERQVVVTMWDLYKQTRLRWSKVSQMSPSERHVTKTLGTIWSRFFVQVRAAGAGEPFASFVDRAKHYGVDRSNETVSFILRRFASLVLNFHRDWVSDGKINDSLADDKIPEVERAVAVYTKVVETWPKYAEAWNRRARAFFLLGDFDAAAADLRQAIALQPNNASAWVGKMLVCMKHKQYSLALDAYNQAIKLSPALDIGYRAADL